MVELKIAVDERIADRVREEAASRRCTVDRVIADLVSHLPAPPNGTHTAPDDEIDDQTHRQRMAELDRILALELPASEDGLSNRDHDQILYGVKW